MTTLLLSLFFACGDKEEENDSAETEEVEETTEEEAEDTAAAEKSEKADLSQPNRTGGKPRKKHNPNAEKATGCRWIVEFCKSLCCKKSSVEEELPRLVWITGVMGSGKTTLAEMLKSQKGCSASQERIIVNIG